MSKKRQRRVAEAAEEYAEAINRLASEASIQHTADEDLFVVDRIGSQASKRRIAKQQSIENDKTRIKSATERRLVEKLTAREGQQPSKKDSVVTRGNKSLHGSLTDIWGDNTSVEVVMNLNANDNDESLVRFVQPGVRRRAVTVKSKLKVPVPVGGLSYNPSFTDHQDAVAEALALELKKKEDDERNKSTKVVPPASDLTHLVPLESDDSEDDEEDEEDGATGLKRKRPLPLTRAQRNKIKARNLAVHKKGKKKAEKDILKTIDVLPHVIRALEEDDKYKEEMKKLRELKKKEALEDSSMTYEEAGAVPLSDELRGSLRSIKPKGSLLKGQVSRMRNTGDLMATDRRKRKTVEKPHAAEKIKWIPKYKYK